MTLPPELDKICNEAAEKYPRIQDADCTPKGSYYGEHLDLFCGCDLEKAHHAGAVSLFETLLKMGPEFDRDKAKIESYRIFAPMLRSMISRGQAADFAIDLLRDQHSLMSAQIAARDLRIRELEAEDQKMLARLHRQSAIMAEKDARIAELEELKGEG